MTNKLIYNKLQAWQTAKIKTKLTNQQRFWKKFKTQVVKTYSVAVNCISSNSNKDNLLVLGSGITLSILNPATKQIIREINSFTDIISAISLRPDGAVMAIADEAGKIEVMDTKQKFHLRTFKNHKKKVNTLDYVGNELYSGGDDMTIRLFDVTIGDVVHSYDNAHSDYIRCVKSLQDSSLLSAGYDKKIKLFDFRIENSEQMEFDHGQPVECIDVFSSKMSFVACGGKKLSLWDIRSSKQPLIETNTSKKLVNCIHIAPAASRIITTSYDNHFKIYRADTLEVTYQEKLSHPIIGFDITKNQCYIGIALDNGQFLVKGVKKSQENDTSQSQQKQLQDEIAEWMKKNQQKSTAQNDKYFYRGIYDKPTSYDIKFERNQNKKISVYDKYLKKFQYKKALIHALEKNNYLILQALVDEYVQRGCLNRTIQKLNNEEIETILNYLIQLIHNPKYSKESIILLELIIEYHQSNTNINWNQIYRELQIEKNNIDQLFEIDGMLEVLETLYP